MEIAGFRFGHAAYLTDVSAIPESSFALLEGLDLLVLSALRHKPHPSHATVEQAVAWAKRIGARQTWLTHIAHELGHEETNRALPDEYAPGLRRPQPARESGACPAMTDISAAPIHRNLIVFRSVAEIPAGFGPTVAAIGNFDGVHLGHQQILSAVVAEARSVGRAGRRHHLRSAPGAVSAPRAGAAAAHAA